MAASIEVLARTLIMLVESSDEAKLQRFEADLKEFEEKLGTEVVEYFLWPIPEGAVRVGRNVKVAEEFFQENSVFPLLKARFKAEAFQFMKDVVRSCPKGPNWRKAAVEKINIKIMEDWACWAFVPVGKEVYLATPMLPDYIKDIWGGPWSLSEDGVSFQWWFTGVHLQPALQVSFHR